MGVVFSLSGSKAVGKTTLIKGLRNTILGLQVREGFRQTDTGFCMDIEEEYYANQRWYINREINEYISYKKCGQPVLLLRGPEDVEFYTVHYPITKGFSWDVEKNLYKELKKLRECRSDYIIYLDATEDVVLHRKNSDETKPRKNMQNWMSNWQPYLEPYMKSIEYTKIIDTSNLTAEEVLKEVTKWMVERI